MAGKRKKSKGEKYFVLTLPLRCEPWQRDKLDTLFAVANNMKNALIAYETKQLNVLKSTRTYRRLQKQFAAAYKAKDEVLIKQLGTERYALLTAAGFTKSNFQKQINKYRHHYKAEGGKGCLIHSHISQKIADSVWSAFEAYFYRKGEEIHFSSLSEFTSISAKEKHTGIIYRGNGIIEVIGMELKAVMDKKDRYGYQREALKRPVRYCSIERRWYASGWKYFLALTLSGDPPIKVDPNTGEALHAIGRGRVGHDIGTQTLASCGTENVQLVELADRVKSIDRELRRINRAMDRSRRAANPQMFDSNGCVIKTDRLPKECLTRRGKRRWFKSKRYRRLEANRRELYRRQREMRIQQHQELANQLLAFGDEHYIEEMRFRALAKKAKEDKTNAKGKHLSRKRFGKSISNKAPATFVKILEQKVKRAGGTFVKVNTIRMRASQFNHISETYTKKKLSQRWNVMPDDGRRIQRDLYSAFLIMNVNATYEEADVQLCNTTYPSFVKLHDIEVERLRHVLVPSSTGIKRVV